jgi:hypothetical protein
MSKWGPEKFGHHFFDPYDDFEAIFVDILWDKLS